MGGLQGNCLDYKSAYGGLRNYFHLGSPSYGALIGLDYGRGSCFFFVCETNVSAFQNIFVRVSASIHILCLQ